MTVPPRVPGPGRMRELVRTFGWLGLTAFGGPAAHLAIMQRELVERRGWLSAQRFVDLLGLSSLLPGPSSTEVALGIGYERGRWPGLLAAGAGFILPASVMALLAAVVYQSLGDLEAVGGLLAGMAPVVIAVIGHAMVRLLPVALTDPPTMAVGVGALVVSLAGVLLSVASLGPVVVMIVAALALVLIRRGREWAVRGLPALALLPQARLAPRGWDEVAGLAATAAAVGTSLGLAGIFVTFLKVGLVVFGSGYVLVAFLGSELVIPGYISQQELLDAIAIGQLTPGPVFTSVTFIGYLLAGVPGALVATAAVFLPAFVLVGLTHPLLPRMRASATFSAAVDGLNAAAVGLIGASVVLLARDAFMPGGTLDPLAVLLGAGAFGLLLSGRLGPVPLLLAGALVGLGAQVLSA